MRVQRLTVCHDDGGEVKNPQLFLTDDHQLLVSGACRKCGAEVRQFLPLTELYKMSPRQKPARTRFTAIDRDILRAMHIALPEDG